MSGKIRIGIIGAGMFGGSVVKVGAGLGIPGIVLNASKDDIDSLGLYESDGVESFIIGDGNGTGKSRAIAKQFIKDHEAVFDEDAIIDLISGSDLIIVAGSAGGGFGSGIVPYTIGKLDEKFEHEKLFICLTTLPDDEEQYIPQKHTHQFLKEIFALDIPYIIYDNNKSKNRKFSSAMYRKTLETIESDLKVLRGDYIVEGIDGSNMDQRDLLTAESTPGRMVIGIIDPVTKTGNIMDDLENSIKESIHADMHEDKILFASATMYNLSEDIIENNSIKHDLKEKFGYHLSDFRNEAVYTGLGNQYIAVILSGCSAPVDRLDQIVDLSMKGGNMLKTRKSTRSSKLMEVDEDDEISLGVKTFGGSTKTPVTRRSVSDVMKPLRDNK